jgi:alpha-1,3-fucosyltransferase
VEIGGGCSKTNSSLCPRFGASCDGIKSAFYFYLALENSLCADYITEKFWDNLRLPVVLIVQRRAIYEGFVFMRRFPYLRLFLDFVFVYFWFFLLFL